MQKILTFLKNSTYVTDTFVTTSIGLLINFSNYLYFLVALRILSPLEFGEINALISVLTISTTIGNVIYFEIVRINREIYKWRIFVKMLFKVIVLYQIFIFFLTSFGVNKLFNSSVGAFVVLGNVILMFMFSTIASGVLASKDKLRLMSWFNLEGSIAKVAILYPFTKIFPPVIGGLLAYGVGYCVSAFHSTLEIVKIKSLNHEYENKPIVIKELLNSTFTYLLLVLIFGIDQIFVHKYAPEISGIYAATMIFGKLVFFIATPIITVQYNYLLKNKEDKQVFFKYLVTGFIWALLSAFILITVSTFLQHLILKFVFNSKYLIPSILILLASLANFFYTLIYLFVMALIVKRISWSALPMVIILAFQILQFSMFNLSLASCVYIQLYTFAIGSVVLLTSLLYLNLTWSKEK